MKVQVTTESGSQIVSALLYAFPKKGNAPADYTLTVNGEAAKTAQTGGGKYPRYVYVMIGGTSHYLPKNIIPVSGSDITIIKEEPKAPPAPKAEKALGELVGEGVVEAAKVLTANPEAVEALKKSEPTKPSRKRIPKAEQQAAA